MKLIFSQLKRNHLYLLILLALAVQFNFPQYSVQAAQAVIGQSDFSLLQTITETSEEVASGDFSIGIIHEPIIEEQLTVTATYKQIPVTAYSSTPDQTDSTPCITANGYDLCEANEENVVAANFLPFGTKVRMPELYGDRIFTVQDRMNSRYYYRMDIWMKTRTAAQKHGIRYVTIEVVE